MYFFRPHSNPRGGIDIILLVFISHFKILFEKQNDILAREREKIVHGMGEIECECELYFCYINSLTFVRPLAFVIVFYMFVICSYVRIMRVHTRAHICNTDTFQINFQNIWTLLQFHLIWLSYTASVINFSKMQRNIQAFHFCCITKWENCKKK